MIDLVATRLVADALADPIYGVSATLPLLPNFAEGSSSAPVPVYDASRHDWCALEEVPSAIRQLAALPCLAVKPGDGVVEYLSARPQKSRIVGADEIDGTVSIGISVLTHAEANDAATGRRLASRIIRATMNAVWLWMMPGRAAGRDLAGVRIEGISAIRQTSALIPQEDVMMAGGIEVQLRFRESTLTMTPDA